MLIAICKDELEDGAELRDLLGSEVALRLVNLDAGPTLRRERFALLDELREGTELTLAELAVASAHAGLGLFAEEVLAIPALCRRAKRSSGVSFGVGLGLPRWICTGSGRRDGLTGSGNASASFTSVLSSGTLRAGAMAHARRMRSTGTPVAIASFATVWGVLGRRSEFKTLTQTSAATSTSVRPPGGR